jgi:hypothetical protein
VPSLDDELMSVMVIPHGMNRTDEVELRVHRAHRTRTREISVPDVQSVIGADGTKRVVVRDGTRFLTEALDDQALYAMSRYAK